MTGPTAAEVAAPDPPQLHPPAGLELPGTRRPLRGLLPDVARSLGAVLPDLPGAGLDLSAGERAVVVLVDGLGAEALTARAGHAPVLRGMLADAAAAGEPHASAGYPSTTAASLGSFGTGRSPGETGLLGYSLRCPDAAALGLPPADQLVNLVSWTAGPGAPVPDARTWQPLPTVFERFEGASTAIGKSKFAGSGLTTAALRGATFVPADRWDDAVEATLTALRRPGLVYLYWGALDAVGHQRGWAAPEWGEELAALDAGLRTLLRRAPRGTTVLVTADHGMVDVTERLDVAETPALREQVVLVAGEPRALHVHLEPGAEIGAAHERWAEALGERAWVLTGADAAAGGLFGPVADRNRALIGDLVVALTGTTAVVDSRSQSAASLRLVGMHGSLTTAELAVPALVTRT
ncbi:alkaline phosphatase family protein [Miniimonas arenae]|uniref:alkaline phosphatase family protein n=1 Tax=Miniimonas arenae TaxID=676201 RepID=UPI001FEAAF63|nr:alkaline phosphatase family protein [Miniimonas arenae]